MPPQHSSASDGGDPVAEALEISISKISVESGLASPQSIIWRVSGSLGNYRLVDRIGSGGMGEVWLAEQTQPVRRRVALKLIKAGMDTRRSGGALPVRAASLGANGPPRHRQSL